MQPPEQAARLRRYSWIAFWASIAAFLIGLLCLMGVIANFDLHPTQGEGKLADIFAAALLLCLLAMLATSGLSVYFGARAWMEHDQPCPWIVVSVPAVLVLLWVLASILGKMLT